VLTRKRIPGAQGIPGYTYGAMRTFLIEVVETPACGLVEEPLVIEFG